MLPYIQKIHEKIVPHVTGSLVTPGIPKIAGSTAAVPFDFLQVIPICTKIKIQEMLEGSIFNSNWFSE